MGRVRASVIVAAAVLVIAAAVLAGLLLVPSLAKHGWWGVRCSLQLDRPAPLPTGTPMVLTFVTSGIRGTYTYEVSVDDTSAGHGSTQADRFAVPVEFSVSGVSVITVTLTVNGVAQSFLFSLTVS